MEELVHDVLTAILDQCIAEHGMRLPLIVCCVSRNGSVLVTRVNEVAEPDVLAEHYEGSTFNEPVYVMVVSQNNKAVRVVIEGPNKIGRYY
jgi:hypothetical protein